MRNPSVSVIVTTYNWPEALDRVLSSLCAQQYRDLEIIVADDGSTTETEKVIAAWKEKSPFPLIHCWQPDEGFRAAMIRNRAVAIAKNDYFIFLDGDCVVRPDFVARHVGLAEKKWFVAGNRILLSKSFTEEILKYKFAIEHWPLTRWAFKALFRQCNRFSPFLYFRLGAARKLFFSRWQGVKTCNLGIWRSDFIKVNGLDEDFTGWGFEDSDLVVRLQRAQIFRKSGQYAIPVLHLWHPNQDRSLAAQNKKRLNKTIKSTHILAKKGLCQYLVPPTEKPSAKAIRIKNWKCHIVCQEKYYSTEMESLFQNIEYYLKNPLKVLKNDFPSSVVLTEIEGKLCVIKSSKARNSFQKIRHFFARSRAKKNWLNAHKLLHLGIPTFTPIAFMEKRWGPFKGASYFICSYIEGKSALEYFKCENEFLKEKCFPVAKNITNMLKKLAQHWISHRDINLSNIILVENEPWLIDLDSMREHHFKMTAKHAAIREYERFQQNWVDALGTEDEKKNLFNLFFGELKLVQK